MMASSSTAAGAGVFTGFGAEVVTAELVAAVLVEGGGSVRGGGEETDGTSGDFCSEQPASNTPKKRASPANVACFTSLQVAMSRAGCHAENLHPGGING
jgi:hypothetical protein